MKNNKAISLITLVIILGVMVLIGCAIAAIVVGTNKNKEKLLENNTNVEINNQENAIEENVQSNEIVNVPIKDEIVFTKEYLQSGKISGNVEIIENSVDNLIILSITGTSDNDATQISNPATKNRWYKTINFDDYNTLEFYARKGHDDGDMMVGIDKNIITRIRFTEFPTTWTKYQIDVSGYTGQHTLVLAGGYADRSGSIDSNTQYCNIKLKP